MPPDQVEALRRALTFKACFKVAQMIFWCFRAGLALQYAADQVEALRRAPLPAAPLLGGRVAVTAILQVCLQSSFY